MYRPSERLSNSDMFDIDSSTIRVGSWPGPDAVNNAFIQMFCSSIAGAGGEVIPVTDPRRVQPELDILHVHWPEKVFWDGGPMHRVDARCYNPGDVSHEAIRLRDRMDSP